MLARLLAPARSIGGRVERDSADSSAVFEPAAGRALPLTAHCDRQGSENENAVGFGIGGYCCRFASNGRTVGRQLA